MATPRDILYEKMKLEAIRLFGRTNRLRYKQMAQLVPVEVKTLRNLKHQGVFHEYASMGTGTRMTPLFDVWAAVLAAKHMNISL